MFKGYWGQVARITLESRQIASERIGERVYRKFLGGSGLGTYLLDKEVKKGTDPLSPENKLIITSGPFQGTRIPGSAKWNIVSISPQTGIFADSTAGASWGCKLKKTGYDGLIIQGKADKPVYILLTDEGITIEDASQIWGTNTFMTVDFLRKKYMSRNPGVACIGQAGENQVALANIVVDKEGFAGRCGLGAVMGSKNLKAIVVCGRRDIKHADEENLNELTRMIRKKISNTEYAENARKHGRASAIIPYSMMGNLPVKYWDGDMWNEKASHIGAPYYTKYLNAKPNTCLYCPVGCHREVDIKIDGKVLRAAGPEYETLGMFGSCLDIDDLSIISKANHLCNLYGIDTISVGGLAGFSIKCYNEGLLDKDSIGDIKAEWGNGDFLIDFIEQLSTGRGLGLLFKDGIIKAAERIGGAASQLAVHVKGLDVPAYDPRAFFSMAISYATGTRGACHVRGFAMACAEGFLLPEIGITETCDRFTMEGKEIIAAKYQDFCTLCNSLVLCNTMLIGTMTLTDICNLLKAVTGWDMGIEELMIVSERIFTLQRQININYGITKNEDKLPPIFFTPAVRGGRAGEIPEPFEQTLKKYYKFRRWDMQGRPKTELLRSLGI